MANYGNGSPGSEQRGPLREGGMSERGLRLRVAALEAELAHMSRLAQERHMLDEEVERLRAANAQLAQAAASAKSLRDASDATSRRQNEFLAMLAHELRNPLAPLSMSASLLDSLAGNSGQLAQVSRVIRRQVDHMAHLLNDLLDAARISSGKISLTVQPLALGEAIEQALEVVGPRVRERRQQLEVRLPPDPLVVEGDAVRLTQVFTNLLGNASKYTGDGGRLALDASRDGDDAVVRVEDNGVGIAADMLPQIFELFAQAPRSLARSEGGLGVGLSVVRNLVGMHGGTVEASSAGLGQGSTFTVRLPLSEARLEQAPAAARDTDERPSRILLIEDNMDACETLHTLLALAGHEVETAADGVAGLEAARSGRFDVVICDIGLPRMDGYGVIAGLRGADVAQPFTIALSGYGQAEDRERARQAGFDRYLVKPAAPDVLLAMVAEARAIERGAHAVG
ncbi:hybrid sensor histidine kinase/response regulator [Massilia niastensis]|uniref:hybrid sensor histidine kinase/response regulator n=1 Tax=Massilia niastensis TaxID=544911 RepID=UPI00039ECCDA|nr:ATP-binding protein [Massilia niastensis]